MTAAVLVVILIWLVIEGGGLCKDIERIARIMRAQMPKTPECDNLRAEFEREDNQQESDRAFEKRIKRELAERKPLLKAKANPQPCGESQHRSECTPLE